MKGSIMKKLINTLLLTGLILTLFPFVTDQANAIPAFARKYKVSCNTCHVAIPKLKAFGDEFAGNGFIMPRGEEPARAYIDTGDETLSLMRDFPIAVRFDAFVKAEDNDQTKTDFGTPWGIKLMSGGRVSKKVSYYFYFYMNERGEVAGVEDAYLHFNNIAGTEFDILVGQFQVSDPLFKRELKLTFEDYYIYTFGVGDSKSNLKYDRGFIFTYGFDFGLDLVAEVLNGNGIGEADQNKLFDMDSHKSFALRASQDLGLVRLGAFGYSGAEKMNGAENEVTYIGPDATFGNDFWEMNIQALRREDTNPDFMSKQKVTTDGGFVEFTYMPQADQSKFLYTLLYNKVDSDLDVYDYETATVSVSHMAARNLRILMEYTRDLEFEKSRFVLGVVSAF